MEAAVRDARRKVESEKPMDEQARILIISCELMRNCDRMAYCFDFKSHVYDYVMSSCLQRGSTLLTLAIEAVNLYCFLEPEAFLENASVFLSWLSYTGEGSKYVKLVALTAIFDNLLMKDYFKLTLTYTPANNILKRALSFLDVEEDEVLNIAVEGFSKLLLFDRAGSEGVNVLMAFFSMYYSEASVTDYVKQILQCFLRNFSMISLENCKSMETAMKQILCRKLAFENAMVAEKTARESKKALKHLLTLLSGKKLWTDRCNFFFSFLVFLVLKALEFEKSPVADFMIELTEEVLFDDFNEKECYVADILLNELSRVKFRKFPKLRNKLKAQEDKLGKKENGEDLLTIVTAEHEANYNYLFSYQNIKQDPDSPNLPVRRRGVEAPTPMKVIKIED
mmetsp:Transcript_29533/g.52786  ORF Transcript_29533/g.52786 Transcript_29533/m.52786 type:complete len:395 (-) Transcript_29533:61-1245(-)